MCAKRQKTPNAFCGRMKIPNIYASKYKYKMMALPAVLFVIFVFIALVYPGVSAGIDLKGGTIMIVRADKEINADVLAKALRERFSLQNLTVSSISSPTGYGATIQFLENSDIADAHQELAIAKEALASDPTAAKQHALNAISAVSSYLSEVPNASPLDAEQAVAAATDAVNAAEAEFNIRLEETIKEKFSLGEGAKFQKREVGAALGSTFLQTATLVAAVAVLFVVIVVFLFFHEVIPSAAIIFAMVFDVSAALAFMALLSIPLSLATISALLMLAGYSIDTDVLLTTRVLKRKEGSPAERCANAVGTGLTMTFTTVAAVAVMISLSYLTQITAIFEIAAVLIFGLIADVPATWMMNAPLLLWYVERKMGMR